jgi:putative ABC transport system substrate-binding protein
VQLGGATDGGTQGHGRTGPRRALLVAGAACAMPGLLRAQPSRKTVRVGFLGPAVPDNDGRELFGDFRSAMERLGWVEGSRLQYVLGLPGEAAGNPESTEARIAATAQKLVAAKVDLIVAMSTPCATGAKSATATIPIVFLAGEPVENGLVASLARPGSNVTGVTYHADSLSDKRMQLLKQAFPAIRRMAYLTPIEGKAYRAAQIAAKKLDVEVSLAVVERAEDLERVFNAAPQADAWIIEDYSMFVPLKERIVGLVASSRKPAVYGDRYWVEAGGLMAYSDDRADWPRRVAALVDRVLRGARPAELPVDQPTRFLLVINRKTARALDVTIAQSVMVQADEVIE